MSDGDPVGNRHIDAETLVSHERFAGSLQQYAFIDRLVPAIVDFLESAVSNVRIHEGHRVVTRCPPVFPIRMKKSTLGDGRNFGGKVGFFLLDALAEQQDGPCR